MANRIGKGSDDFLELHNGTRPPMSQKEREGFGFRRSDVNEVDS